MRSSLFAGALTLAACATPSSTINKSASYIKDGNFKCTPTYSQVYQPALKLGGAGRVVQVPSGENCVPIKAASSAVNASSNLKKAKFTSLPQGALVTVHKNTRQFEAVGVCKTPCTLELDPSKNYIGTAQMAGSQESKGEFIPVAFPPNDDKGISVYFTRTAPMSVTLSALSAPEFSVAAGNAVYDKDAQAAKYSYPLMPWYATKAVTVI